MGDIKIGYDEPVVEFDLSAGGTKDWMVTLHGERDIVFSCVSKEAAENLAAVIEFGVYSTEVKRFGV